ncbi:MULTISPECIES: hypothetical protein [unclassified Nostoc]|uniref:hypothetical protein n=1 Tax=unclassified Nostoc TaxID=2593658 RepID=UPI002AD269F0|nr:hypothetical protein [Nostoc sp. DedQUE03]MDZ7976492.1 hypothetical protein [Nostoc sp. DedQUE03]MDZ8049072.1 hypothetical protein [Nostoc sp. DedQUE02]
MLLQLSILSVALGFAAHCFALLFGLNVRSIPYLEEMMNTAISLGLYINVLSIDPIFFKRHLDSIIKVIVIGVPIKIILPGFLLTHFSPRVAPIAFLCATVIAQIDPIAAAKSLDSSKISRKSETILRAWSSFDDPITVLFAFYIFLPLLISNNFSWNQYLVRIAADIISCITVYYIYYKINKWLNRLYHKIKTFLEIFILVIIIVYSVLSDSFILPAFVGIFLRPIASEQLEKIISAIFYFSVIVIGLLSANLSLDWLSGGILAFSTFFLGQVIVTFLFLKDSMSSKARVMFGHQNGMTAILLTVAIEVSGLDKTRDLLSVTLPAIILIALFYFGTNYLLDRLQLSSSTDQDY